MNRITKILLLSILFFGCQDTNNDISESTANKETISYLDAQAKCKQIKEAITDGYTDPTDCMCGSKLPQFSLTTISGKEIKSSDLNGKPTLINFWFTTCPPCIAETPGFNDLVKKYGEKINFISIARNSKSEIEEFLKKHPWNFNHISNEVNIIDSVFNHQFGYPTTYLLDKYGIVTKYFVGGATGENAGDILQSRLTSSIEEALRLSPKKSRKTYPRHIGDIAYNPTIDDQSFRLCNDEQQIIQYFNDDSNGLQYDGEKSAIIKAFKNNYQPSNSVKDSGLITIRFVVNCKGETGRYRMYKMDNNFNEMEFNNSISDQILAITKSLEGWKPKTNTNSGMLADYYQMLSFKIENGKINEILP